MCVNTEDGRYIHEAGYCRCYIDYLRKTACEAIRRLQGHCPAALSLSLGQAFELMPGYCQEGYGKPHTTFVASGASERGTPEMK